MSIVTGGDLDGLSGAVLLNLNESVVEFLLSPAQELAEGENDAEPLIQMIVAELKTNG